MTPDPFGRLLDFIRRLDRARIHYQVASHREDGISVLVTVPGQRWEVDFLADGEVDVERFVSDGRIDDAAALDELFEKFADPSDPIPQAANPNGVVPH